VKSKGAPTVDRAAIGIVATLAASSLLVAVLPSRQRDATAGRPAPTAGLAAPGNPQFAPTVAIGRESQARSGISVAPLQAAAHVEEAVVNAIVIPTLALRYGRFESRPQA
jgi:hypothetical protein